MTEIRVRKECIDCGGRGSTRKSSMWCGLCDGTGWVESWLPLAGEREVERKGITMATQPGTFKRRGFRRLCEFEGEIAGLDAHIRDFKRVTRFEEAESYEEVRDDLLEKLEAILKRNGRR